MKKFLFFLIGSIIILVSSCSPEPTPEDIDGKITIIQSYD